MGKGKEKISGSIQERYNALSGKQEPKNFKMSRNVTPTRAPFLTHNGFCLAVLVDGVGNGDVVVVTCLCIVG